MAETSTIKFSSISSDGSQGKRDCAIDLTDMLETSETVDTVEMVSSDDTVLTVSNAAKNAVAITAEDGSTIAIGKGVQFQIAAVAEVTRDITLDMLVTGNSGTRETYEILVPVVDKIRK